MSAEIASGDSKRRAMRPPREVIEFEEVAAWPRVVHVGLWLLSAALLGIFFYRLADGTTSIWLMMLFPVPVLTSIAVLRSSRSTVVVRRRTKNTRSDVDVRCETTGPATISVHATSSMALKKAAAQIAREAPGEMRFNAGYSGKLMLLLGPLDLCSPQDGEQLAETLKSEVAAEFPGEVAVEAVWAEKRR